MTWSFRVRNWLWYSLHCGTCERVSFTVSADIAIFTAASLDKFHEELPYLEAFLNKIKVFFKVRRTRDRLFCCYFCRSGILMKQITVVKKKNSFATSETKVLINSLNTGAPSIRHVTSFATSQAFFFSFLFSCVLHSLPKSFCLSLLGSCLLGFKSLVFLPLNVTATPTASPIAEFVRSASP